MALANISKLYSGGAQVFNTTPHLVFQARLLAQERAKRDALDAYYSRLPGTANEKGTRDIDREPLSNNFLEIKRNWLGNKDRIRNGDQEAIYNYEKMIRDYKDKVASSQSEHLSDLQVGKINLNPALSYMFQGKDTIEQLSKAHKSVYDPEFQPFDMESFTAPPKPYDRTTYFKNFAQLKPNENVSVFKNMDGVTQTVVNERSYDEPQKNFVLSVAADKYLHDPSFTNMIDNDLGVADATNPLNADFKENFGHNIQTPIDLATAYTFNGLKPPPITEKIQPDQGAMMDKRQKFAKEQQARGAAFTRGNIRYAAGLRDESKSKGDVESADAVLHNIYDIVNEGEKVNKIAKEAAKGTPLEGAFNNMQITISDPNLLKNFAAIRKVGTTPVPADLVTIDKNKDQINLIYNPVTYANGETQAGTTISMSGRDYIKQKVRETYPNKDIGQINNLVDKVISKGGGLYKTIQMYDPANQKVATPNKTEPHTNKTVKGLPVFK